MVTIEVLFPFVYNGAEREPGTLLEVTASEATRLVYYNRARLVTVTAPTPDPDPYPQYVGETELASLIAGAVDVAGVLTKSYDPGTKRVTLTVPNTGGGAGGGVAATVDPTDPDALILSVV